MSEARLRLLSLLEDEIAQASKDVPFAKQLYYVCKGVVCSRAPFPPVRVESGGDGMRFWIALQSHRPY